MILLIVTIQMINDSDDIGVDDDGITVQWYNRSTNKQTLDSQVDTILTSRV